MKHFKKNSSILSFVLVTFLMNSSCNKKETKIVEKQNFLFLDFQDSRDGQTYRIVKIGYQWWFAQNLNYQTGNSWRNTNYGCYYDWKTANSACPKGWHLPSDDEFTQLTDYLGGISIAGGKMKSTTGWLTNPNNINYFATNISGFSALPGGVRIFNGSFVEIGRYGYWWSSTKNTFGEPMTLFLGHMYDAVGRGSIDINQTGQNATIGMSCRCVMN
jgi:uncharacterized protein (TIGR02145 family)